MAADGIKSNDIKGYQVAAGGVYACGAMFVGRLVSQVA